MERVQPHWNGRIGARYRGEGHAGETLLPLQCGPSSDVFCPGGTGALRDRKQPALVSRCHFPGRCMPNSPRSGRREFRCPPTYGLSLLQQEKTTKVGLKAKRFKAALDTQ